jgi:hypothetical protein
MKIAIVCDDYKFEKFKKELDKAGFTYTTNPSFPGNMQISVDGEAAEYYEDKEDLFQSRIAFS